MRRICTKIKYTLYFQIRTMIEIKHLIDKIP